MDDIKVRLICGDSYVSKPPILSENGENVFVSWKNSIYSYCVKTGKRINEYRGSKNTLLTFNYICKCDKEIIVATSKNAIIHIWDVPTTALLERLALKLKHMIDFHLVDITVQEDKIHFKGVAVVIKEERNIFYLYDSKTDQYRRFKSQLKEEPYKFAVGGAEDKFVMLVTKNMWRFVRFNNAMEKSHGIISEGMEITAVACHPTEECVLIGDNSGRILLIQALFERIPTRAKFHWHSLPVRTLAFSASGTSFYSGGEEAVLVKWNINDHHNKEFLPRLPASIKYITCSPNNSSLAISTEDNAIHLVDPQFKSLHVIQQYVVSTTNEAGIVFDERSKCLVFNSLSGHIQFFRPHDSSLIYSLDIVGQNKVTGESDFDVQAAEINAIGFSKCGKWMGTIEQRINTNIDKEIKLKFWNFNETDQKFHLNTCIDFPHEEPVTKIVFQPSNKDGNLKCVTISKDKKFKIWENSKFKTIYREGFSWKCIGAAYYKNEMPYDTCFSSDSSLLAVAFGSILTTWLPDTCELKCSLLHTNHRYKNLRSIAFGIGNHCHLIVTATKKDVSVWNLLTLSMMWTTVVDTLLLIADPYSSHMAVFTTNNKLIVFTPDNSTPIYVNRKLCQQEFKPIAGVFVRNTNSSETSNWYERSQLYVLDDSSGIRCIDARKIVDKQDVIETDIKGSIFQFLTPLQKPTNLNARKSILHNDDDTKTKQKIIRDFLDLPVHTMPPVKLLCKSILQALCEDNSDSKIT